MTWGPHPTVRMFFYGTLKRGGQYHDLCRGGTLVSGRAEVDGLLYDLPEGYPALLVPPGKVLAVGSDDYLRDARDALVVSQRALPMPDGASVHGEVYEFGDPVRRLPILDTLEGFDPADPAPHVAGPRPPAFARPPPERRRRRRAPSRWRSSACPPTDTGPGR